MSTKQTLKAIFALSLLTTGCASDSEQPQPNSQQSAKRQQAVRSADATSKLFALSGASIGASKIGARSNFTLDLSGDIEAGIEEFVATLEDESCVTYTIEEVSETEVNVDFDFDACVTDSGLEDITGSFDVDVTSTEDELECDFDADFEIDGIDVDGQYEIDSNVDGTGVILGDINLVLPDGAAIAAQINGVFKDIGTECPSLTQHIEIGVEGDLLELDLSGIDMCATSLCASGASIVIEDALGAADVDFSEAVPEFEGLDAGLVCGDDGDLGWDPELDLPDTDVPAPDLDEVPEPDLGDVPSL